MEIWRNIFKTQYARRILEILKEVFKDVVDVEFEEGDDELECTMESEWEDVRDDSDMNLLFQDTTDISNISKAMSEFDQSDQCSIESSNIVNTLAYHVSQRINPDNMDTS